MRLLIILFLFITVNAQQSKDFDAIFTSVEDKYFDFSLSLEEINTAISECPNISEYPDLLFYRATILTNKKNYPEALANYFELKKYVKTYQLHYDMLNNIGVLYTLSNHPEKAKSAYLQALEFAKKNQNKEDISIAKENLLIVDIEIKGEKAIKKYEDFIFSDYYHGDSCSFLQSINILLEFYLHFNAFDEAKNTLAKSKDKLLQDDLCNEEFYKLNAYKASIALNDNNPEKSLEYLLQIKINNTYLDDLKLQKYKLLKQTYKDLDNRKMSNIYNDSIIVLLEKNVTNKNNLGVETVSNKEQNQKKTDLKFLLLIGFITILIFSLIGFFFFSKKNKMKLNNKIQFYKEKYDSLWANHQLSNKQLLKLKEELSKQSINKEDFKVKSLINNITLHLNNLNQEDNHVDLVKDKFINALHTEAPYLSDKEKLICFFINLNISHKKIAELLNKTEKSIDSHKYRINKKVKLNHNMNIENLIKTLKIK